MNRDDLIFKTKNEVESSRVIEFSVYVDESGDLNLAANGRRLLYVDRSTGEITLWSSATDGKVEGLKYTESGFPYVYGPPR